MQYGKKLQDKIPIKKDIDGKPKKWYKVAPFYGTRFKKRGRRLDKHIISKDRFRESGHKFDNLTAVSYCKQCISCQLINSW